MGIGIFLQFYFNSFELPFLSDTKNHVGKKVPTWYSDFAFDVGNHVGICRMPTWVRKTAFVLLVLPSPSYFRANIGKPVLVTATTVSVTSDVTMQSVNVTSVPVYRSISKKQRKTFFTKPQPCYVVQLMYVNCVYIAMMFTILLLALVSQ